MVAPSCCLEYRPTLTAIAIIVFGVFPAIYCVGKIFQFLCVLLFRALAAVLWFIFFDDYEKEERIQAQDEENALECKVRCLERELARFRRKEEQAKEREKRRNELLANQAKLLSQAEHEVTRTNEITKLLANGGPRNGHVKNGNVTNGDMRQEETKLPSEHNSHSDSPISECEDEISQATTQGTAITELDHTPVSTLRHRFPVKKLPPEL